MKTQPTADDTTNGKGNFTLINPFFLIRRVADNSFLENRLFLNQKKDGMKTTLVSLLLACLITSCVHDEIIPVVNEAPPSTAVPSTNNMAGGTSIGTFVNGTHPTSGMVKVLVDSTDKTKQYLSFENLMSDAGPDLYIYVAENTQAKNFVSVGKLTQKGTFSVAVPSGTDLTQKPYVLIWCQQFSVLFGSAKLN
ncbi:MAG: DM13 domain-containing protein [Spirosomataceae bacterium]